MHEEERIRKFLRLRRNIRALSTHTERLHRLLKEAMQSKDSFAVRNIAGEMQRHVTKMESLFRDFDTLDKVYLLREKKAIQGKLRQRIAN